jgi:predicted ester cyclase
MARNIGHSIYGPPTGRRVIVSGIANCIIKGENVVEEWVAYNEISLLRQLGLDVGEVLRRASANDASPVLEPTGEIDRLVGQGSLPEFPPKNTEGFDIEDFVRRGFHDIWNRRMFGEIPNYYAPNYHCHGASDRELYGLDDFTQDMLAKIAMFPDATVYIDDLYWNDDGGGRYRTAVLWTMLGTHNGPGIYGSPTGRRVRVVGITQHRVRGGKFVEEWTEYGEFNLMKQLLLPIQGDEAQARGLHEEPPS